SVGPLGLSLETQHFPRACARGYTLPPLRGSQRHPAVVREPFDADQYQRRQHHVKPQLPPQPIMLRPGVLIGLEYGSVDIRETRIREIHRHMNALISLRRGIQAGLSGLKYGLAQLLFRSHRLAVD